MSSNNISEKKTPFEQLDDLGKWLDDGETAMFGNIEKQFSRYSTVVDRIDGEYFHIFIRRLDESTDAFSRRLDEYYEAFIRRLEERLEYFIEQNTGHDENKNCLGENFALFKKRFKKQATSFMRLLDEHCSSFNRRLDEQSISLVRRLDEQTVSYIYRLNILQDRFVNHSILFGANVNARLYPHRYLIEKCDEKDDLHSWSCKQRLDSRIGCVDRETASFNRKLKYYNDQHHRHCAYLQDRLGSPYGELKRHLKHINYYLDIRSTWIKSRLCHCPDQFAQDLNDIIEIIKANLTKNFATFKRCRQAHNRRFDNYVVSFHDNLKWRFDRCKQGLERYKEPLEENSAWIGERIGEHSD